MALALAVHPLANVCPAVRVALQPFALHRGQAAHDHGRSHNSTHKVCAVLKVPLLAAACNLSSVVISEPLHLIRQRHLVAARTHSCLQTWTDLAAVSDDIAGVRHIQRHKRLAVHTDLRSKRHCLIPHVANLFALILRKSDDRWLVPMLLCSQRAGNIVAHAHHIPALIVQAQHPVAVASGQRG